MKKRIISMLVLLAAVVSGAWADAFIKNMDFASTEGWTLDRNNGFSDLGNGLIGTYQVRTEFSAATVDATHTTDMYCLGVECRWSTSYAAFTQTTDVLPAGQYTLTYDVMNVNQGTSQLNWENRFSVRIGDETIMDNQTEWMNSSTSWTAHSISFTLNAAASVTISLGFGTGNNNIPLQNTPALYISNMGITYIPAAIDPVGKTFDLTVGESTNGTVKFYDENGAEVTKAAEGQKIEVKVTPNSGFKVADITATAYAEWSEAMARRMVSKPEIELLGDIELTNAGNNSWTFNMPASKVKTSVKYEELPALQNEWITAVTDQMYTGSAIEPALTVKDGDTNLTLGTDYTVAYTNNINAGEATATLTAVDGGNYKGTASVKFNITPKPLAEDMLTPIINQAYTGEPVVPNVELTYNDMTLVKGTDFNINCVNNVEMGMAEATITAIEGGNYLGSLNTTFNIVEQELTADMILDIEDCEYTGEAIEPEVIVKDPQGNNLIEGRDYEVEYKDNVNPGTAKAVVTGIGGYAGQVEVEFSILKKQLDSEDITVDYIFQEVYDGDPQTPMIFVRDNGGLLLEGRDYKVTYKDNIDAGSVRVTIDGLGGYKGRIRKYFNIKSYVLDVDMIQAIADQAWTGKAVTPAVGVINGNVTLVEGRDYTVKFKNNVNEGTATVIVNGTGNFRSVDLVTTFKIVKKPEVVQPEVEAPGEATAIDAPATAAQPAGKTFDLQGREATATQKGVVIIDGKLVLKK